MQKQSFNTLSVLQFYLCLGLLLGFLSYVLITSLGNNDRAFVQEEVEIIALRLKEFESSSQRKKNTRGPASTRPVTSLSQGELGQDPWGQAYQYIILKPGGAGAAKRILVWSLGPDQKNDLKNLARQWIKDSEPELRVLPQSTDDIYVFKNLESL